MPIKKIIGVGGGGCNTITRMIDMGVQGVNFIAINTDIQSLNTCKADIKLQMGVKLTNGLGTGSNPDLGEKAAEENKKDIEHLVEGETWYLSLPVWEVEQVQAHLL